MADDLDVVMMVGSEFETSGFGDFRNESVKVRVDRRPFPHGLSREQAALFRCHSDGSVVREKERKYERLAWRKSPPIAG